MGESFIEMVLEIIVVNLEFRLDLKWTLCRSDLRITIQKIQSELVFPTTEEM